MTVLDSVSHQVSDSPQAVQPSLGSRVGVVSEIQGWAGLTHEGDCVVSSRENKHFQRIIFTSCDLDTNDYYSEILCVLIKVKV